MLCRRVSVEARETGAKSDADSIINYRTLMLGLSPFDGGRITAIISPRMWFAGVPIPIALFLWRPSPLLVVIAILAAPQLMKAFRYDPAAPENVRSYGASLEAKLSYAVYYLALTGFLAIMANNVHEMPALV